MLVQKLRSFFRDVVTGTIVAATKGMMTSAYSVLPEIQEVATYRLAAANRERTPAQITADRLLEESYLKYVVETYKEGKKPVSYFEHRVANAGFVMAAVAATESMKAVKKEYN